MDQEIGECELQKSVTAVETFEALTAGENNVERIRNRIRSKRKLIVSQSNGEWTKTASKRFINKHGSVLDELGNDPAGIKRRS